MPESPEPKTRRRLPRPEEPLFEAESFGDLSEAAREAVRQPADPRIDTHLAHLGLTDGPVPRRGTRTGANARAGEAAVPDDGSRDAPVIAVPDLAPEVERLRATIAAVEATLAASERRARLMAWGLAGVAVVAIAAVLLALR
jgi:hypothetical protein